MIQENEIFIGRKEELKRISEALQKGKHVLLLGKNGCGKTALVLEFIRRNAQENHNLKILLSSQSGSLKDTCLSLVGSLCRLGLLVKFPKELQRIGPDEPWEKIKPHFLRLRTTVLKNLVFNHIQGVKNLIVVLDHLGKVKSKFFFFLDSLRDQAKLILIARGVQKKETGQLWMMLWGFEQIKVEPLTSDEAKRLAAHWLGGASVDTADQKKWYREAVRLSGGNPEILRGLCDEIRKQSLEKRGEIHVRLANIDRQITSLQKEEE